MDLALNNRQGLICHKNPTNQLTKSNGLMSYPGHSLEESYSTAEMYSVYSTALANKPP